MYSIGIIWNKSYSYKNCIIDDINQLGHVVNTCDIDLDDNYEEFVRKIYDSEDMEEWKINNKLDHMLDDGNRKICVVLFEFDSAKINFDRRKNKNVYSDLETIKTGIRSKYKNYVNNYTFDVVFHSSDNINELKNIKTVLDEYNCGIKKYVYCKGA